MTKQRLFATLRTTGVAALSAGFLVLSACEERAYPPAHQEAPPPPAAPAELMGAPTSPYPAPPAYQQPAYAPPADQQPAYATSPYDNGAVVAMAPIPNPGDPGSEPYYDYGRHRYGGRRVHARYEAAEPAQTAQNAVISPYGEGHPAPGRHPSYSYPAPASPAYPPTNTAPYPSTTGAVAENGANSAQAQPAPANDAGKTDHTGVAVAGAGAAGLLALNAKHAAGHAAQAASTHTAKTRQSTPTASPATTSGDQATNLASLQTALTDAVGKTAVLKAPARFTANQPTDVSLTLPAGFGDTMKSEAQKDGLADAAASVSMTALLSGDGFAVTPNDTQSAPLTLGQPTQFHWTVTANPSAKGPLHADVGADLLGGGSEKLALGSVRAASDTGAKLAPHFIGVALLVLLAVLVVAWLVRERRQTRPVVTRRTVDGRPLDMSSEVEETTTR